MKIEYDGTNPYNKYPGDYGTIYMDDGTQVFLLGAADATNIGTDGDVQYVANAVDAAGNTYMVKWQTLPGWDGGDEEHACDWDDFEVVED